jgi:non-heme chloroperoxidase
VTNDSNSANFPHGMPTTQAETINADLLAFLKG